MPVLSYKFKLWVLILFFTLSFINSKNSYADDVSMNSCSSSFELKTITLAYFLNHNTSLNNLNMAKESLLRSGSLAKFENISFKDFVELIETTTILAPAVVDIFNNTRLKHAKDTLAALEAKIEFLNRHEQKLSSKINPKIKSVSKSEYLAMQIQNFIGLDTALKALKLNSIYQTHLDETKNKLASSKTEEEHQKRQIRQIEQSLNESQKQSKEYEHLLRLLKSFMKTQGADLAFNEHSLQAFTQYLEAHYAKLISEYVHNYVISIIGTNPKLQKWWKFKNEDRTYNSYLDIAKVIDLIPQKIKDLQTELLEQKSILFDAESKSKIASIEQEIADLQKQIQILQSVDLRLN